MDKVKIMIVDDEYIVLQAFANELERAGYHVYTASRGRRAIEIAAREKIDIVFTDMIMPEMDGVEVCRGIKEISSDTEVILVTGYPEEVVEKESGFFDAGGRREWLKKPIDIDALPGIVQRVLHEKRENQEE